MRCGFAHTHVQAQIVEETKEVKQGTMKKIANFLSGVAIMGIFLAGLCVMLAYVMPLVMNPIINWLYPAPEKQYEDVVSASHEAALPTLAPRTLDANLHLLWDVPFNVPFAECAEHFASAGVRVLRVDYDDVMGYTYTKIDEAQSLHFLSRPVEEMHLSITDEEGLERIEIYFHSVPVVPETVFFDGAYIKVLEASGLEDIVRDFCELVDRFHAEYGATSYSYVSRGVPPWGHYGIRPEDISEDTITHLLTHIENARISISFYNVELQLICFTDIDEGKWTLGYSVTYEDGEISPYIQAEYPYFYAEDVHLDF